MLVRPEDWPNGQQAEIRPLIVKVTDQGVLIPKSMLGEATEVEIIEQAGRLVIIYDPKADPIWKLGKNPITLDVDDASVNLDKYLYDNP